MDSDSPAIGESLMSGGRVGSDGDFEEKDSPDGVLFESKMISLNSTSGRPNLEEVMDVNNNEQAAKLPSCLGQHRNLYVWSRNAD